MDKKILLVFVSILILLLGTVFYLTRNKNKGKDYDQVKQDKKKIERINEKPLDQRPFVSLTPSASGGEVFLSIDKSKDKLAEYEIEYQAKSPEGGTLIQGGTGKIDLSSVSQPTEPKEFCFCSESKGRKRYDIDVSGGSLLVRFSGGAEDYSLKGDFTVGKLVDNDGLFSTRNSKANLDLSKAGIPASTVVIVADTLGLPGPVDGKVLEGPVGFFTAGKLSLKAATLTFKTTKDLTNAKILGWDEKNREWQDYSKDARKAEDSISTTVDQLSTYILVLGN